MTSLRSALGLWLSFPFGWCRNVAYRRGYTRIGRFMEGTAERLAEPYSEDVLDEATEPEDDS